MTDDTKLARAASRGDRDALERLVRGLASVVYGYLLGVLAGSPEAEEATEETFVRMARAIDRYQGDPAPQPWVLSIARRVVADHHHAPPGDSPVWEVLARLPVPARELVVCRDLLGWDDQRISQMLAIPAGEVAVRLAGARASASQAVSR